MANHMSRYRGLSGNFAVQLSNFRNAALEAFEQTFREVFIQCGTMVIQFSPVDTGLFKGNWQFSINAPAAGTLEENFDKEGDDSVRRLIAFANTLDINAKAFIVNNLPYAIPLEYGHSRKAPHGMVGITIANFDEIVKSAAARYAV